MKRSMSILLSSKRRWFLIFGILPSLTGCWLNNSPATQFYLLEPTTTHDVVMPQVSRQVIVLAPVRMAPYLNTTHIVTALGQNRYQVSDFDRWAESLGDNIQRVLQQDLARLLAADVVSHFSGEALHVSLAVLAFHVDAQGEARLEVQWQLSKNKQIVKIGYGDFIEQVPASDYVTKIAGMNACLAKMERALMSDIQAQFR